MGRAYRIIKDGKFVGEPVFHMNVSSYIFLGRVCDLLGLPCSAGSHTRDCPVAMHAIVGDDRQRFSEWWNAYFKDQRLAHDLVAAIRLADEEQGDAYDMDTVQWTLQFFGLCATSPEGIASDYCEEFANDTR